MSFEGPKSREIIPPGHLVTRNLSVGYRPGKTGIRALNPIASPIRWVFKDLNLDFKPGTITAVLGRNGSGKSTLLRTLESRGQKVGSLITQGQVLFQGERGYIEIVDEPFQHVGREGRGGMIDAMKFLKERNPSKIQIMATHLLPERLTEIVDTVIVMGGEKPTIGSMAEMREHDYVKEVVRFSENNN